MPAGVGAEAGRSDVCVCTCGWVFACLMKTCVERKRSSNTHSHAGYAYMDMDAVHIDLSLNETMI